MKNPIRVAVTGAAGNIGYALLFRLASGGCFGKDQPIILQLLEITPAMKALEGVAMELNDAAFPLLHGIELSDDPNQGFKDANQAFLVGSRPRGPGMLRSELVQVNGPIFTTQGKALNNNAASNVRVIVVGNPCNTNALIAMNAAPDIPQSQFSAMTRLDQNRAVSQLAGRLGATASSISHMSIYGNHGPSMYPDFFHAKYNGEPLLNHVDETWLKEEFVGTVAKRGKAIINARGKSSAASAAAAAIDHMASWWHGTNEGEIVSMAVASDGSYGVPEGLIFSFPVTVENRQWSIVQGIEHNEYAQGKIQATIDELLDEKKAVAHLLG